MDVLFYIIWVLAFMVIAAIGIGVPYMTYYNYKRIKAMDKKLTGMCTGLGIMLRPEEGVLQMKKANGQPIYPDANSTLRLTYGKIGSYEPADGKEYLY